MRLEIWLIEHPQAGNVYVRETHVNDTTRFNECTKDGELVRSATPFYAGLSRDDLHSLGARFYGFAGR